MPENSESPMMGRFASEGLGFLSSTCGFPVRGSIGSFSQTTTPQIPEPHFETRTFASPAWVSQMPSGLPAAAFCALVGGAASNAANATITSPNLQDIHLSDDRADCIATNGIQATPSRASVTRAARTGQAYPALARAASDPAPSAP